MKIYRVEDKNGKGICIATGSKLCLSYRKTCPHTEKEHCDFDPLTDCKLRNAIHTGKLDLDSTLFAFPSIDAFHVWFPEETGRKAMAANGARGVIYECTKPLAISPYQVLFQRKDAKQIGEFEL